MKYPAGDDPKLKKAIMDLTASSIDPFYLYDEAAILRNKQTVDACFSWQEEFINYFPLRENPNPTILSTLWNAGSGILACGTTELLLCKQLGFSGDRVMYQPDAPDAEGAAIAAEIETAYLVTSPMLMPKGPCKTVVLRFCPDHVGRSQASFRTKSGLTKSELLDLLRILQTRKTPQIGLEINMRPFDYGLHAFSNKAKVLFSLLSEISEQTEAQISICNLGDTVQQNMKNGLNRTGLEEEADLIRKAWEALPSFHRPIIQTSLSKHILESAGVLISKIIEIRHLHQSQLVLNVSAAQFLRPALFHSQKDISILHLTRRKRSPHQLYSVVGPIPEEFDKLLPERVLLSADVDDICVIHDVGCGARSMPVLYNFQPVCAEYIIDKDGEVHKIAEKKTSAEVMEFLIGNHYDHLKM